MIDLRCGKRLHGRLTDDGVLEVACRSALCGHVDGVVVIHRFDVKTGELIGTDRYRDTPVIEEEGTDGSRHITTVRNA